MTTAFPLANRRVIVTRAAEHIPPFKDKLQALGAEVISIPIVRFVQSGDRLQQCEVKKQLDAFDWIVFTSANAVRFFVSWLDGQAVPAHCRIAAVGTKTAEALRAIGFSIHVRPLKNFTAEGLLDALMPAVKQGERVLFPKSRKARSTLVDGLLRAGVAVTPLTLYDTITNEAAKPTLIESLNRSIDYVTFTSPSTVQAFVELTNGETFTARPSIVCIGPITGQAAKKLIDAPLIVADDYTIEGMIDKLIECQ